MRSPTSPSTTSGGGVETTFKEDRQKLDFTKRSKKHFAAQQVVVALGALAHNVLVRAKHWLREQALGLARYGVKRLVHDVFWIDGRVELEAEGRVTPIVLKQANRLARWLLSALLTLAAAADVVVSLGET